MGLVSFVVDPVVLVQRTGARKTWGALTIGSASQPRYWV
jgi:hypothetical protein